MKPMRLLWAVIAGAFVLALFSAVACYAAVVIPDPVGDFDGPDFVSVTVDVTERNVVFTLTYAGEVIGTASGVGGFITIDADRNAATGEVGSGGYEFRIMFNVSNLAPTAHLDVLTGPNAGRTVPIGGLYANGTDLTFTASSVTITFPQTVLGTVDFDFVAWSTGMFAAGDRADRAPDVGAANSNTGLPRTSALPSTGGIHSTSALPSTGVISSTGALTLIDDDLRGLVERVETSLEGGNAVWVLHTRRDLPVDALAMFEAVQFQLFIDADETLDTGIKSADIPFLPFGPDRVITVTATAGKQVSVETLAGTSPSGERLTSSGGPGLNDLQCTVERRSVRLRVPLFMIGVSGPSFTWLLTATRPTGEVIVQVFKGKAVRFDTGATVAPLAFPPRILSADDPLDARTGILDEGGRSTGRSLQWHTLPNSELTRLDAAIQPDYLMVRVTYHAPFTSDPDYLTGLTIRIPSHGGVRDFYVSYNRHVYFGGQAVLFETTPGSDATDARFIHQCLAIRGNEASLLLPASLFGPERFTTLDMHVETHQISASVVPGKRTPQEIEGRSPEVRYGEHRGLSPGTQTTGQLDRLPNTGEVRLSSP